jgi:hypothetical protein
MSIAGWRDSTCTECISDVLLVSVTGLGTCIVALWLSGLHPRRQRAIDHTHVFSRVDVLFLSTLCACSVWRRQSALSAG